MLTNSEKKVIVFIIVVLICGSLAGFFRVESLEEENNCVFSPVDINTATKEELTLIPYIGPVIAERILTYRHRNKGFKTKDEVLRIKGIGKAKFEKIEDRICVGNSEEVKNNLDRKVYKKDKETDCGIEDKKN